jgi:hypothetical protein
MLCAVCTEQLQVFCKHTLVLLCLHEGAGVFQKITFYGRVRVIRNQLKQTISADYSRATATEEEEYLHAFKNSSLLHGNEWSDTSPGHIIPSRNPIGGEIGWADESVWRR